MKDVRLVKMLPLSFLFLFLLAFTEPEPYDRFYTEVPLYWHDLVTPDMEKSESFYNSVFGWEFRKIDVKGLQLATIYDGDRPIAGVIEVPEANTSVWLKTVYVNNLENRVSKVKDQGGKVLLPPARVPGRGMQVVLEGVDGEEFALVGSGDMITGVAADNSSWAWSELWAEDPAKAREFYETAFEVQTASVDYGNQPYWIFQKGTHKLAGMIKNPLTNQGTQWVPYVEVNSSETAVGKAEAAGGFIVLSPDAKIRDGKVGIFQDPMGAIICVQHLN
ncbi:VOC family protein [Robertkochia aurantiaca]|uniref:VOC family protein n=1 Tax=Robertkochia aurantiaca TaxID=2873700 RepID=UPI001CCD62E2|nr:VOC family protein [Robertkochia sp. 3YJGBD-33]